MPPPQQPLSAFALKALDDEYLTGGVRAPHSTTKASVLRRAQTERQVPESSTSRLARGTTRTAFVPSNDPMPHVGIYDNGLRPNFTPKTTGLSKVLHLLRAKSPEKTGRPPVGARTYPSPTQPAGDDSKSILKKHPASNIASALALSNASTFGEKPQNNSGWTSRRLSVASDNTNGDVELLSKNNSFHFAPPDEGVDSPPVKNLALTPMTLAAASAINSSSAKAQPSIPHIIHVDQGARSQSSLSAVNKPSKSNVTSALMNTGNQFASLEEYLSEAVVDRLTSPRKVRSSIATHSVAEYEREKQNCLPFSPTIAPKSQTMNSGILTPRMELARQRRIHTMLSSPATNRIHRSNSTVSSVWGADSEIAAGFRAIKPPSEYGDSNGPTKLYITKKAHLMTRSIQDLFDWKDLREEQMRERHAKHQQHVMRQQQDEERETFAYKEQEFHASLAKYKTKRAKRAAKKKKVTDFLSFSAEADSDAKSDSSERFRFLNAPTHVDPESARLVRGMGDRRIDVYDHAQMHSQARSEAAIARRNELQQQRELQDRHRDNKCSRNLSEKKWCEVKRQNDFEWFQSKLHADTAYY